MTLPENYDVCVAKTPYTLTSRPIKPDQTTRKAILHKASRCVYVVKGCIRKRKQQQLVVLFSKNLKPTPPTPDPERFFLSKQKTGADGSPIPTESL